MTTVSSCKSCLHSTMVRLKASVQPSEVVSVSGLHSTMVRLKGAFRNSANRKRLGLHSTMVRLKDAETDEPVVNPKFTFHYGKIKSVICSLLSSGFFGFTFHYGKIKSMIFSLFVFSRSAFTFHYGKIKRKKIGVKVCTIYEVYIPLW